MDKHNETIRNVVFRPVQENDLDAIYQLAFNAPDPITSLPPDKNHLDTLIHHSLRSFYPVINQPGSEFYFFVLDCLTTGKILGTSAIFARVGGYEPFYTYEIREATLRHAPLGITKTMKELHLQLDHDGPSEIGSLYLEPAARGHNLGTLLSLSRFLFISLFPGRFGENIIAELRGICDESSQSPFWNAVGHHFFDCDYLTADHYSAKTDKSFLRDLMPRHPIYIPLLPKLARDVIGQVHENTRSALGMLQKQGFSFTSQVDIFDAGPVYKAPITEIRAIQNSTRSPVSGVLHGSDTPTCPQALIARADLDFRSVSCPLTVTPDGSVMVPQHALDALSLKPGDSAIYLSL